MRHSIGLVLLAAGSACGQAPPGAGTVATVVTPLGVQHTAHARADAAPATAGLVPHLDYHGGSVLASVKPIAVMWGPNVNGTVRDTMGSFYSAAVNNVYMDWLDEYDTPLQAIGRGTGGGTFTITPSITSASITDDQIQAELAAQINAGVLPRPDSNTIYMVSFPSGMGITAGGDSSCDQFCAYHNNGTVPAECHFRRICIPSGPCEWVKTCTPPAPFVYAVLPDLGDSGCVSGCGASTQINNQTSAASHELIEAVTDPNLDAWFDSSTGNEIGDICNQMQAKLPGTSYVVQREWSNKLKACI
jgi:hypothetical protein